MKKILLVLALFASIQIANAQFETGGKSPKEAATAYKNTKAATEDAKAGAKSVTWIKYGNACLDAYDVQVVKAWPGASKDEVKLYMNEEPTETVEWTVAGAPGIKATYEKAYLYFDGNNQLRVIVPKEPIVENALENALVAFKTAQGLDNGKKIKDITAGIQGVHDRSINYAYDFYTIGDLENCYKIFKLAYDASITEPYAKTDTSSLFDAANIALACKKTDEAETMYKECVEKYNFYGEDGEIYAKLAVIQTEKGDKESAIKILEDGFTKYPESQSILLSLINRYIEGKKDPARLFEMINIAKKNDPTNASLWYVEGNIKKELGDDEGAIASYNKSSEINPAFEYGYIGIGQTYYDKAIKIQEAAQNEMDDAKYMALVKEFEDALKSCITYFEKGFELTTYNDVKVGICEYIKNASFRFREEEPYKSIYEKYNSYYEQNR